MYVTKDAHMSWQLYCWVCDAYNTQKSGKGFKTTCIDLRCHFSAVSLPNLCLFWVFPSSASDHGYSQVTGWHTFQRTKSPSEDNTRFHAHLSKGTHMQTQTCALSHLTCTKLHTHKHSHPKSSSVMPSKPTLDKPLCEPDKAGEGTQQPLNAEADCIRQLRVPINCIYTLQSSALNPKNKIHL